MLKYPRILLQVGLLSVNIIKLSIVVCVPFCMSVPLLRAPILVKLVPYLL